MFIEVKHQQSAVIELYINKKGKPRKKKKLWNSKQIGKLLLTITMVDLEQFTPKNKLVIYTKTLVEF